MLQSKQTRSLQPFEVCGTLSSCGYDLDGGAMVTTRDNHHLEVWQFHFTAVVVDLFAWLKQTVDPT